MVELYAADDAEIKYSTVQNWYAGDEEGRGGIYNFVTKRGLCAGDRSKISWTQVGKGDVGGGCEKNGKVMWKGVAELAATLSVVGFQVWVLEKQVSLRIDSG